MARVNFNTLTMEQYLALSRDNQVPGVVKPEIGGNVNFEIKSQFMRELREDTFSGNKDEDAHDHIDRVLSIVGLFNKPEVSKDAVMLRVFPFTFTETAKRWVDRLAPRTINTWDLLKKAFIQRYCPPFMIAKQLEDIHNFKQEGDKSLYQAWERYNDLLYKCPTHDINSHQKGPIPGMRPAEALTAIQTMADHSQKWHDDTTSKKIGSSNSSDGLAALVNKSDAKFVKDLTSTKLNEEVKQVEKVRYGEFGQTMHFNRNNGGKFRVGPPGYYTKTDNRPPYRERRQNLEELLAKNQEESARRSIEIELWIKKLQENAEINTRNQSTSLKNLEAHIEQLTNEIRSNKALEQVKTITADQETFGLDKLRRVSFILDPENKTSEVLQHQLPRKELNPGNFTLPCTVESKSYEAIIKTDLTLDHMGIKSLREDGNNLKISAKFQNLKAMLREFLVKCKYVTRNTGKGRKNEENMDSSETLRLMTLNNVYFIASFILLIMEYLVNISKRHAFWSLNEDILKIYYSDYQYAVSIKEDTAYPCLHSPKTTKERRSIRRIQKMSIRRIEDIVCEYSRRCQYAVLKIYYAYSESLLLTSLCCDDIHEVTPRVSALAWCDRLVAEPLVIENHSLWGAAEEGIVVCLVFQEWAKEQEEAFQTLKGNLGNAPILSLLDRSKEFVVYCDVSNQGLGCVLMQRGKVENATAKIQRGMDQLMKRKEGEVNAETSKTFEFIVTTGDTRVEVGYKNYGLSYKVAKINNKAWSACVDHLRLWWKIYFAALVDIAEGIENRAKTCVRLIILKRMDKLSFGCLICCMEGSVSHTFFGLKLEKSCQLDQNWYKRQQIRIEVGDKVMLEVSSWKDVVHFGKKEMLAPRYVGPFKYLADTNLHVHLEEINVDKTLCFVEEHVEIIDRVVKSLKRSRIPIVKSIGTRSEVMRIS
ncbi:hypothetical protein Tco_0330903 [Tanacetum coccineum]